MAKCKRFHLEQLAVLRKLPPHQILLVDDSRNNVDAARADGFHACHVRGLVGFRYDDMIAWGQEVSR